MVSAHSIARPTFDSTDISEDCTRELTAPFPLLRKVTSRRFTYPAPVIVDKRRLVALMRGHTAQASVPTDSGVPRLSTLVEAERAKRPRRLFLAAATVGVVVGLAASGALLALNHANIDVLPAAAAIGR